MAVRSSLLLSTTELLLLLLLLRAQASFLQQRRNRVSMPERGRLYQRCIVLNRVAEQLRMSKQLRAEHRLIKRGCCAENQVQQRGRLCA